ncbi:hypothetical protein SKAU_G00177520 [Synaphobranchus kaupii]|uniref:ATP-grasp fold succinyl-CoA synthetase-type domain-containing protein n=1 Tax=Synaphobranchus kaupii TaxID=118154 RepID=A0A9Q1FM51_SYNKA|nr:hypothetical protein SKAU_G00177520 [Synaphobranchus kaupii]
MAASMASQAILGGLRGASAKYLFLEKSKLARVNPRRWLNLQEYQSKKLMRDNGVAVQRFLVADTPSDALEAAKRLSISRRPPHPFDDGKDSRSREKACAQLPRRAMDRVRNSPAVINPPSRRASGKTTLGPARGRLALRKDLCTCVSLLLGLIVYDPFRSANQPSVTVRPVGGLRAWHGDKGNPLHSLAHSARVGTKVPPRSLMHSQHRSWQGGEGKGVFDSGLKGGVHLTKDPAVVGDLAGKMLGYNLTTKQTPKEGVKVKTVMVAEALDITRETYFAILMDRACNGAGHGGQSAGRGWTSRRWRPRRRNSFSRKS